MIPPTDGQRDPLQSIIDGYLLAEVASLTLEVGVVIERDNVGRFLVHPILDEDPVIAEAHELRSIVGRLITEYVQTPQFARDQLRRVGLIL